MVSSPTIDPLEAEPNPPEGAYLNRCLAASFVPGSVFKLVTAAAAIEKIPDLSERRFLCEGAVEIAGVEIVCSGYHGEQTFEEALSNSCNVAFSQIAVELGQEAMVKKVRDLGFLDSQRLDGIPTVAGSFPTDFVGDPELGWAGVGQSTDLLCPYSLLRFVAAVANDGELAEPRLIRDGSLGSSSRLMEIDGKTYVMGLLAQTNYGASADLRAACLPEDLSECDRGSVILIAATDLPLSARQLKRVLRRASVGMARLGSYIGHGSGEIAVGFTTAPRTPEGSFTVQRALREDLMNLPFRAIGECAEEAILQSMLHARPDTARDGTRVGSLAEYLHDLP